MAILKNPLSILREAAEAEEFELIDLDVDDIKADLDDTFDGLDEVDDDELGYTEEMVVVFKQQLHEGVRYLVESDNLVKFMKSANITDVSEAVKKIAKCNDLDDDDMCIVIDPEDDFDEIIEEAKKYKKPGLTKFKSTEIKTTLDVIKQMKTKGVKVAKRKSKKAKKKKK